LAIPLRYNWRNVFGRKLATGMTVAGIALVVAVYLLVLSLAEGMRKTFAAPVSSRAIVALRVGAQSDSMSILSLEEAEAIRTLPGIELDPQGRRLVSPEIVVLIRVPRKDGRKTNIVVRGVQDEAFALRPTLTVVAGRRFRAGSNEAIVSRQTQRRF
jgi:putative ABC transport system permease protein